MHSVMWQKLAARRGYIGTRGGGSGDGRAGGGPWPRARRASAAWSSRSRSFRRSRALSAREARGPAGRGQRRSDPRAARPGALSSRTARAARWASCSPARRLARALTRSWSPARELADARAGVALDVTTAREMQEAVNANARDADRGDHDGGGVGLSAPCGGVAQDQEARPGSRAARARAESGHPAELQDVRPERCGSASPPRPIISRRVR